MATGKTSGSSEFMEFLKSAPTLEEASSQDATELTGIVSRTTDGKFAITTPEGQTYELDTSAVQRFRADDGPGFSKIVTIQVSNEALKAATLRPIKPIFKDIPKDPIKELINDGKFPPFDTPPSKDVYKDPVTDKRPPIDTLAIKDIKTDPAVDQKHLITDPGVDTSFFKDVRKDPLRDPVKPAITDPLVDPVKNFVDENIPPDPIDPTVNPAAGLTPFAMATPHHAPQHLLAMQMGMPQAAAAAGVQNYKPAQWEKHPWGEKLPWSETRKEIIWDTRKEIIRDTFKEMVWDPPTTWIEGIPDPTQVGGPVPDPWGGAGGMQGFGPGMM